MANEAAEQKTSTQVKKFEENTKDMVIAKIDDQIQNGDLIIPNDYAWKNAVQSGWLHLMEVKDKNNNPALEVCTKESVAIAFLDMIQQGLSVTKKQGYFVVYGNKLSFDPSYFGSLTIAKRDCNVKEVNPVIVYKGDEFEYEIDNNTGRQRVVRHVQKLENINMNSIIGAYAIVVFNDGSTDTELMTYEQIKTAWSMGGSRGNSPAHQKFPDRMAAKTVMNRALTILNASADDSAIMSDDDQPPVQNIIKSKANKTPIGFDTTEEGTYTEIKEDKKQPEQPEPNADDKKEPEAKEQAKGNLQPSLEFDKPKANDGPGY